MTYKTGDSNPYQVLGILSQSSLTLENMKKFTLVFALAIVLISTAEKCSSDFDLNPESATSGCFANSPLENISWAKDQLATFQTPKSGPLRVVVFSYRNEDFLAFEGAFMSSPMFYIFDCSGVTIAKRGINYNAFYDEAKEKRVLLEGTY